MIEIMVKGLAVDAQSKQPVVILTDPEEKRFLPIWIGISEADAILLALEKIPVPRPGTHDLLKSLLEALKGKLERVVIHSINENTFYAHLVVQAAGQPDQEVDSRPSDAIALALRAGAPIFVSEAVMSQAAILDKGKAEKDIEDFKEFIEKVKPSDFVKYDNTHQPGSDLGRSWKPDKPEDDEEGPGKKQP